MSHPTSLAALAALLAGADARATVTDRDDPEGHCRVEMFIVRVEAEGVAVDVEMEAVAAPGGPVSLHDPWVRPESTASLAASGLAADPFDARIPNEERTRAKAALDRLAFDLMVAHADAIRGQLARTTSDA